MPVSPDELSRSIGGAEALAEMLRRVRHDRELSERDLALRLYRPVDFVVRLEAAQVADLDLWTAAKLARCCEVSISLLVVSFALPKLEPLPWPRDHRPGSTDIDAEEFPGGRAMGATLRELRLRQRWTIWQLAERSGIHASHIGRIERGGVASPGLLILVRFAHAFAALRAAQLACIALLAMSYAGEIPAPPLAGRPVRRAS